MILAYKLAQHSWERPSSPRMSRTYAAVTTHHHPGLLIESLDIFILHRVTNDTRTAIANNAHVKLHRSDVLRSGNTFHRLEFIVGMCLATHDGYVRRTTYVGKATRHVDRIVIMAARNQDPDR